MLARKYSNSEPFCCAWIDSARRRAGHGSNCLWPRVLLQWSPKPLESSV